MKMLSSMETMESSQSDVINGASPCTQRASNHEGPISAQALTCYEVHYSHEFLQSLRRSCCCEAVVLQARCCKSRCCRHGVKGYGPDSCGSALEVLCRASSP